MFVDLTIKTARNIKTPFLYLFIPILNQNVASSSQDQIMEPSLTEPNFSREPKFFFFFEVFLYEKFNNRNSGMEKK